MIVVCGEALVDLLPAVCGGSRGYVPRPGGSPANVAVGLARLGAPAAWFGRLSTDPFGSRLHERFTTEEVDLRWARRGPEPTALALVELDARGHPEYSFWWSGTADRLLVEDDLPRDLDGARGGRAEAVHVGSVSLALPPACDAYAALVERERGRRVISVDPNVRAALVGDRAVYRARLQRILDGATLVKVSDEDLDALAPGDDPEATARSWAGAGRVVVLTRGASGSRAWADSGAVDVPARPAQVVDTVGAGDAFVAGLLARLREQGKLTVDALEGLPLDALADVVGFAAEVAARTCERPGADPPRRGELPG